MKFDVVIIGGGLAGMTAAAELQNGGLRCAVVAEGLSLNNISANDFKAAGGTLLRGDRVTGGTFGDGRLLSVCTAKLGDVCLEADYFILATGKYFSRGLAADMDKVYEPLFGLDVEYDPDRSTWFDRSFAAPQKFLEFGVKTQNGAALKNGEAIINLFPAGEVLQGISSADHDAREQIIESAHAAAQAILKRN